MAFDPCGLFSVLVTPFQADGALDTGSLARLVDFNLAAGASGLLVLGMAGEAAYLSEDERQLVAEKVATSAEGRPVVAGVSDADTNVAASRAAEMAALGVSAVMVAVPPDVSRLVDHVSAVAAAANPLGVIVQDYPPSGHPKVSAQELAALARQVPSIVAMKAEDPSTPNKIAELLQLIPHVRQLGGLGGLYGFWELKAGSAGMITGFAFPEHLIRIIGHAAAGDWAAAQRWYERALPAMVWESQPGIEVGLRKLLLHARGVIDTAVTRAPMGNLRNCARDARSIVASQQ